jgi:hypothetical protein
VIDLQVSGTGLPLHCNGRDCSPAEKILQEGDKPRNPPPELDYTPRELYIPSAAVLSMRLLLLRGGNGKEPALVLQKEYSRAISLQQKTAAAVAGWDKALSEIMAEATSDLAAAK